uniref:Transposase-like Mu C-terminal domain-containing protein n=1 Tax=Thermodesulfovibrio aggregans TaxID=86166 RepID=A0A7C4AJR9_9BACT
MKDKPTITPPPLEGFFTSFTSGGGVHLFDKGGHQAGHQNNEVDTIKTVKGGHHKEDIFLARQEVQNLLGINKTSVLKAIKKGRFKVIETYGNGGRQYRIALSSLPAQAQIKWVQENINEAVNLPEQFVEKLSAQAQWEIVRQKTPKEEAGMQTILNVTKKQKDIELIQRAMNPPQGVKKSHWIAKCAESAGITVQALYKKIFIYKNKGITGLVNSGSKAVLKKWSQPALSFMQGVYLKMLKEGGSGVKKKAYDAVIAEAEKRGWSVGSKSSAYEYLDKLNPLLERYAKGGIRALDNVFYIVRQYDDLAPFECIVGDQHRFDFFVQDEETGKVFRPEGYFWIDLRTRNVYGMAVTDRYNSYLMGLALRMGLKKFGKFKVAYTDNGKPEVSKYFNNIVQELNTYGMKEQDISELYKTQDGYAIESGDGEVVNVVPTKEAWHRYARPYNAKAKLIERFFRTIEDILVEIGTPGLIKDLRSTSEEKALSDSRLKKLLEEGSLLTYEEFLLKLFKAVEIYSERKHYALKQSPYQELIRTVKEEGFVPSMIIEHEIDFILMARTTRSVNRGRILLDGILYEGESLENGLWDIADKTKIEVRYDLYDRESIYAIRPDGKIVQLVQVPISSMKNPELTSELIKKKRKMIAQIREEWKRLTQPVPGVIEYSARTKAILKHKGKKQSKPEEQILDRESFEKEVKRRVEMTKSINSFESMQKRQLIKPSIFASEREKYKYLVDCEMEGVELSEQEKLYMRKYEAKMEDGERMWWENYRRLYKYERRIQSC